MTVDIAGMKNSARKRALIYFRDNFAGKVDNPRTTYPALARAAGTTVNNIRNSYKQIDELHQEALSGHGSNGAAGATPARPSAPKYVVKNGRRYKLRPDSKRQRILDYYEKNWLGRCSDPSESYEDIVANVPGINMSDIYCLKNEMRKLETRRKVALPAVAPEASEPDEPEEDETPTIDLTADMPPEAKAAVFKMYEHHQSLLLTLKEKDQELALLRQESIRTNKSKLLMKSLVERLLEQV